MEHKENTNTINLIDLRHKTVTTCTKIKELFF